MPKILTASILAAVMLSAAPASASITKPCMLKPTGPTCPTTRTAVPVLAAL